MSSARKILTIILLFSLVSGCVRGYPPLLRSEINDNIEYIVYFKNGDFNKINWQPCVGGLVGRGNESEDEITGITVLKNGNLFSKIDANEVSNMIDKQKSHYYYSVWSLGHDGKFKFLTGEEAKICNPT
jgi:hypothetical protein